MTFNNSNSQRTSKIRLSPAQINTGKWVRPLNIITQEQVSTFCSCRLAEFLYLCLSYEAVTQPHTQMIWKPRVPPPLQLAAFNLGLNVCLFLSEARGTTVLNSQTGLMFTPPRAQQKQYWHLNLSQIGWVCLRVCECVWVVNDRWRERKNNWRWWN